MGAALMDATLSVRTFTRSMVCGAREIEIHHPSVQIANVILPTPQQYRRVKTQFGPDRSTRTGPKFSSKVGVSPEETSD